MTPRSPVKRSVGSASPSRRPSTACRARRLASRTRSASSRTTIASRLSSTSVLPRSRRRPSRHTVLTERLRVPLPSPHRGLSGIHHSLTRRSPSRRPRDLRRRTLWCCRMAKVLIIEDDDVIARGMARHLETAGFDAVGVANGETGPRAPALRAPRRLRPRPDASRHRRLARDRAGARRGDRHADRRRVRARHRARPRARARDRRRRLPREAVLDEGARRPRPRGRPARSQRRGAAARRRDRDRGAAARPRQRAGVRRRHRAPS